MLLPCSASEQVLSSLVNEPAGSRAGGSPAGGQMPQLAKARRQQRSHLAWRYAEEIGSLSMGESAEYAQRQARAVKPGELAEPHHDRRQVGSAG